MNGFLKATFTRQKFQGLFVNTALGNFAGYVAGSLVTCASTRRALEGRAIGNIFGLLPRKKVVVHLLPHWLEWLLALLVGFLVMEAVRFVLNHHKYAAFLNSSRAEPRTENSGQASKPPDAEETCASESGSAHSKLQRSTSQYCDWLQPDPLESIPRLQSGRRGC